MTYTKSSTGWQRTADGYQRGDVEIFDNGAGMGPASGSKRWAVVVAGSWIANVDTLAQAKNTPTSAEDTNPCT